jgi:hypothetical protein
VTGPRLHTDRGPHPAAARSRAGCEGMTLRRALGWAVPLLVGALVAVVAVAHPVSTLHGDAFTGPMAPPATVAPPLGVDYRVSWTKGYRAILLRVRDGAGCRPPRPTETSTAPARIEVVVHRPTGAACAVRPRWWRYDLGLPTVAEPGQLVSVWVNGRRGSVPRYERPTSGVFGS